MDESVCSCHVSTRQEQGSPELLNSLTVWPRASICNHLITSTLKPRLLLCRFTAKKIHDSVWEGALSLFREGLLNGRPGDRWWQCQMNHQPLFLRTVCKHLWGQSSSGSSCSLEVKSGKNLPWEHNVFWVPVKQLPLPTACFMGEEVVCKTAGDQTVTELWSALGAEQEVHGALVVAPIYCVTSLAYKADCVDRLKQNCNRLCLEASVKKWMLIP